MLEKSSFHDGSLLQRSGDSTVVRGAGADSSRRKASSRVKAWDWGSFGRPAALPNGKSLNRKRGAPQYSTMSFAHPMTRVAMPFSSKCRAAETHGLVAHRSIGDENGRLDAVGAAARQEFGAVLVEGRAVAAICRRAVEARRDLADPACRRTTPQLWERKPSVAVLCPGVRAVDAKMGNPQIMVARAVPRIDRVELGRGVVGRSGTLFTLARLVGRCRRDNATRHSASGFARGWNGTSA